MSEHYGGDEARIAAEDYAMREFVTMAYTQERPSTDAELNEKMIHLGEFSAAAIEGLLRRFPDYSAFKGRGRFDSLPYYADPPNVWGVWTRITQFPTVSVEKSSAYVEGKIGMGGRLQTKVVGMLSYDHRREKIIDLFSYMGSDMNAERFDEAEIRHGGLFISAVVASGEVSIMWENNATEAIDPINREFLNQRENDILSSHGLNGLLFLRLQTSMRNLLDGLPPLFPL